MRAYRPSSAIIRATVAVVALYALVLQALLGGMAAAAVLDPAHVLCLADSGTGDGPEKSPPAHGGPACCTATHSLDLAGPDAPPSVAVVWPERARTAAHRRPEIVATPRAPPRSDANPRAPPAS